MYARIGAGLGRLYKTVSPYLVAHKLRVYAGCERSDVKQLPIKVLLSRLKGYVFCRLIVFEEVSARKQSDPGFVTSATLKYRWLSVKPTLVAATLFSAHLCKTLGRTGSVMSISTSRNLRQIHLSDQTA